MALSAIVAVVACAGTDPDPTTLPTGPPEEPTTVTTPQPPTTTATVPTATEPAEPTTTSTAPTRADLEWPGEPPARYAVVEGDQLAVTEGEERWETTDLPDVPTAGGFVDDVLYFSLGCCDGIWRWDYSESNEALPVVGEESDEQTTLHGIAYCADEPGFFYSASGEEPGDTPELRFYDLAGEDAEDFFSEPERRPGLTEEEQTAAVGKVVATEDLVGVLFAFGDSTWIEWYTRTGEPAESRFGEIGEGNTVLDMALAPEGGRLAVGIEEELHRGISILDVVGTDGSSRSFSVAEGQSLRDLHFDGRYVTASVFETEDAAPGEARPAGSVVLDIESGDFRYFEEPRILALGSSR